MRVYCQPAIDIDPDLVYKAPKSKTESGVYQQNSLYRDRAASFRVGGGGGGGK